MSGYFTIDQETRIAYKVVNGVRKEAIHGPTFRDPNNDVHTIIYGSNPNRIKLVHSKKGFRRRLPRRVGLALLKSHTLITQNGKFDMAYFWKDKYFQKWLLNGGKLWDCAYVRYLLSYQRHQYPSLAEMQKIYLKVKTKIDRISYLFSKFIGADEIIAAKDRCPRVWKLYCDYGIQDGRTPMLIMQKQYAEAKNKGMLPVIELFNAYLLSLTMIEQNGIPVDMNQLEINERLIHLEYIKYLDKAQELAKTVWNDPNLPPLNINSPDHRSLILFGGALKCKVKQFKGMTKGSKAKYKNIKKEKIEYNPDTGEVEVKIILERVLAKKEVKPKNKYTTVLETVQIKGFGLNTAFSKEQAKKGFYQTGEPIIIKIFKSSKNDLAKEFCKYMGLAAKSKKMLNTYIKGIKDRTVNGKLYPNLNNTEVITTRLSSSKINMQNIPATGKYNKLIQGLFVAPPGWTCISIDFSQLEVYVQAMLSKDKNLIHDLKTGKCLHCQNVAWAAKSLGWSINDMTYEEAYKLCKIDKIPEWDKRRGDCKPITFGKAYGKEVDTASKDTGIPKNVMQHIYDSINAQYPEVALFEEQVAKDVYANTQISKKSDYAEKYTHGTKEGGDLARRFLGEAELLPIKKAKGSTEYYFDSDHLRHIGFYRSPTGKRYAFEERATKTKTGDIYKYFLSTQMKNYAVQGGASDIQACTTVAMFQLLLRNPDKVLMLNEIHDSKWFIVKNEYLSCIVPKLCDIMSGVGKILKKRFNIETDLIFANEAKMGTSFCYEEMKPFKLNREAA